MEVFRMNTELATKQSTLPQSSLTSGDKIEMAIHGFGEEYREMVFCKYQKGCGIEKAVGSNAPTFHDVTNIFGEKATTFWLRFHIAETFVFLGIYDTASKCQVQQTADLIMQHEIFGQLTLQEFLCFLTRFKRGDYGKIYNSNRPNPQEFLQCLQPFWNDVSYWRGKQAEKDRVERLSAERHSDQNITWEQYCQEKNINKINPLERNEK
jgi:hypothetical protein